MMHDLIKPIAGILTSHIDELDRILDALANHFGGTDIVSEWLLFDHTRYYEEEMGTCLKRCFVAFEKLAHPEEAKDYKTYGIEVESRFKDGNKRRVNIDPGYIDANKVVLISGKHGGHKIAIAPGAYADMLLWYNKGWEAFPWAFPDFRDKSLFPTFVKMRTAYKAQMKNITQQVQAGSS
ncbi:MAG: DUF4416 family protein [Pseudomonadota bacterium]